MSLSRFGRAPKCLAGVGVRLAALAVAALAAGCSSTQHAGYTYPGDAHAAAVAENRHAHARKPDVEDDGMEAQPEPARRQFVEPDDPSEPFSPNYGNRPGDPPRQVPAEPPRRSPLPGNNAPRTKVAAEAALPADLPPYFKRRLVSADVD
jgi:hypothetical protein